MARHWDRVFTGGIVWDPREPLPPELQRGRNGAHGRQISMPGLGTTAAFLVREEFDGSAQTDSLEFAATDKFGLPPAGSGGIQAATISPVASPTRTAPTGRNLPRFTVQEEGRNVLPPLSVKVDASIVQDTAQVVVTQLFWNDSTAPIKEAAFTFPLPAGCTVTDFSCRIGLNKIIRGSVKPREEAREKFQRHIRTHDTAAGLLEQDTPEIFTTTLGNIPEKTKVKVNLTYITVLKHRFAASRNVTTLTIPTSIARRYGDAPAEYNGADTTNVPQGLTLEVEIVESEKVTAITSPSHVIDVKRRRGARKAETFADLAGEDGRNHVETATVALPSRSTLLRKDFVLDIETRPDSDSETPQAWLEEHPTLPNHRALMLTLPPQFLTQTAPPLHRSEILFLADLSGSMADKILSLKSAMHFFLKGIPEGRKFNIWCFGDYYTSWQQHSVDYAESTLNSALSWVESNFDAYMGGTELLPAIQAIVQARDRALMTDVIVLTDGEVWRLDQTLDYIQNTRLRTEGRVRFFALGIGQAVSHALVDGIAKAGGGYAEVVQDASRGGWEDRVVSMTKAALLSAHLGPLHLSFEIQGKSGKTRRSTLADAKTSPADVSALSPFNRSRVYFVFDSTSESETITSVRLEMTTGQEVKTAVIPVTVLEKRDTMLHKLAARSMLDDLERGRSHIHLGPNRQRPGSWAETNMVRKEAEEIACKWSLVSKWTSFFLVEEPYSATEKDPFMDGVVEVKTIPADDLLQSRWDTQHIGALEPTGLDISPWRSSTFDDSYWGQDLTLCQQTETRTQPLLRLSEVLSEADSTITGFLGSSDFITPAVNSPGTSPIYEPCPAAHGSSSPDPDLQRDLVPPSRHRTLHGGRDLLTNSIRKMEEPELYRAKGRSRLEAAEVLRTLQKPASTADSHQSRFEEPDIFLAPLMTPCVAEDSESEGDEARDSGDRTRLPGRYAYQEPLMSSSGGEAVWFISSLLDYQQYDGAIDFVDWATAEEHLGKEITRVLKAFSGVTWQMLWTAAVHVLLERDFQSCKALWGLMGMKAANYCQKVSAEDSNWLWRVKKVLEGLKLPLHQRKGQGDVGARKVVGMETAAPEPQGSDEATGVTQPHPQPEVDTSSNPAASAEGQ